MCTEPSPGAAHAMAGERTADGGAGTALSLVLPCFNEEACLEATVPPLAEAFRAAGIAVELVLVDNGSTDGTAAVIERLATRGLPIIAARVPHNRGQGLGIRTGLALGSGPWVGYVCADGQVEPADVVRIYQAAAAAGGPVLAKARRCNRRDGLQRRIVSAVYNGLMRALFPGLPSRDVNGNPKILPRAVAEQMELGTSDWFLEAEIMLKARHLRLRVIEVAVEGKAREGGRSHVRGSTVLEFLANIATWRVGGPWAQWRRRTEPLADRRSGTRSVTAG